MPFEKVDQPSQPKMVFSQIIEQNLSIVYLCKDVIFCFVLSVWLTSVSAFYKGTCT